MLLQWESFKAAMHFSAKPAKLQQRSKSTRKLSMNSRCEDTYPKHVMCHTESFSLTDHTAQILAEQLTLMEQVDTFTFSFNVRLYIFILLPV